MEILDVDLLAFETGSAEERRSVVDSVLRSLATGFVYVEHDLSIDLIDEAYAQLEAFFTLPQERKDTYVVPGSNGQSGHCHVARGTVLNSSKQRDRVKMHSCCCCAWHKKCVSRNTTSRDKAT